MRGVDLNTVSFSTYAAHFGASDCMCVCVCARKPLRKKEISRRSVCEGGRERESNHFENVCVLLDVDTRVLELKRVYTIAERERSDVCACV